MLYSFGKQLFCFKFSAFVFFRFVLFILIYYFLAYVLRCNLFFLPLLFAFIRCETHLTILISKIFDFILLTVFLFSLRIIVYVRLILECFFVFRTIKKMANLLNNELYLDELNYKNYKIQRSYI